MEFHYSDRWSLMVIFHLHPVLLVLFLSTDVDRSHILLSAVWSWNCCNESKPCGQEACCDGVGSVVSQHLLECWFVTLCAFVFPLWKHKYLLFYRNCRFGIVFAAFRWVLTTRLLIFVQVRWLHLVLFFFFFFFNPGLPWDVLLNEFVKSLLSQPR